MIDFIEKTLLENWKIKGYALLVSLVLWTVILGQRTLVVTKEVPVEYLVSPEVIVQDSIDKIMVTISAKRSILQSFNPQTWAPTIDLRNLPPGSKRIPVSIESINTPIGAKVLAIEPKLVTLYLKVKTKAPKTPSYNEDLGEN